MPQLSRFGDSNEVGGTIMRGAGSVFANGIPIGINVSQITSHAPWGAPHPLHEAAMTTDGSPSVFVEGVPVLRTGSGTSCGHPIIQGSPDIFCP